MRKLKKCLLVFISSLAIVLISYGVLFYFNFFQEFVTVKDNKVQWNNLPDDTFKSCYAPKLSFSSMPVTEISQTSINLLGNPINNIKVLEKAQRYYIPLKSICTVLGFSLVKNNSEFILTKDNMNYILSNTDCIINGQSYSLRGNLIFYENKEYISISDIEYIFNLVADFDMNNKVISLLTPLSNSNKSENELTDGKVALIRLEDFSAESVLLSESGQMKFKIIGNYLNSQGIKYHIAWVPRYKSPSNNIDNDLLSNISIENVGFINTLDYLINHGGQVGLHGYSHQAGNNTSISGIELSHKYNSSEEATRSVLENAIDTASALNIPCTFFESPHYKATSKQKEVIKEYFQYLYEPNSILTFHKIQRENNNLFIPTPLGYVDNLDVSSIEKGLAHPTPGELASLFYHPYKELNFINFSKENFGVKVDYSSSSPLQQIVTSINRYNYRTIHVSDLKN
ncbi:DUF2334 domain-containing protein [Clostridium sp. HBUAS56017]|uniref:DUF2334 domain-containing protein n=1 Tax=Clostridium sp. HBUAS56017 TaxID=2571128 RepID=UPI00117771B6|nr:DUF2334 domain-containing protein [Clostridium sp. HBUAS56017]